jgi:hypothetical protein
MPFGAIYYRERLWGGERRGRIFRKIQCMHKTNDMFFWLATLPVVQRPEISEGCKVFVFAVGRLTKQERLYKIPQETRSFRRNFPHSFSW